MNQVKKVETKNALQDESSAYSRPSRQADFISGSPAVHLTGMQICNTYVHVYFNLPS